MYSVHCKVYMQNIVIYGVHCTLCVCTLHGVRVRSYGVRVRSYGVHLRSYEVRIHLYLVRVRSHGVLCIRMGLV